MKSLLSRTYRTPARLSLGWILCAALSGCSQAHDDVDASTPSEAGSTDAFAEPDVGRPEPDAPGPDRDADGFVDALRDATIGSGETGDGSNCPEEPVWNAASLTFALTSSGGFVPPPPPDAGCTGVRMRYDFSKLDRTLVQRGCTYMGAIHRRVYLTDQQYDAILANISAMKTTCTKGCGADYPTVELLVAASGVAQVYSSNFYAGCPGSTLRPPFVSYGALGTLSNLLATTASAVCNPDAGSGDAQADDAGDASAGSCMPLPPDDGGVATSY